MAAVGPGQDVARRRTLIISAADRADPRPLWVPAWGGTNTLAQALLHVRATRTPAQLDAFVSKLRVYTISDQDDAGPWIRREFPTLHYIAIAVHAGRRAVLPRDVDRHQRRSVLPQRARRRLHDVHRRVGQREHPQQGAARQALSAAVLHPRRRHAVVPRPDRQRPRPAR